MMLRILPLFALVMSGPLLAQDARLSGKVTDSSGREALIGVNVVHAPGRGTATGVDGTYQLALPAGEYTITFSFVGYTTKQERVVLSAGEERRLDMALAAAQTQLDMVVVTAGRFEQRVGEVTQSLSVLRPELIQNKNITNVSNALEQVPGVVIIDEDPQIRAGSGFSYGAGSRVMVLVDDLPVLSGDIGRVSWGFLPTENLEQLEVIKGASSVLYGSAALTGVINVRTAYPRSEPITRVNLFAGVYDKPGIAEGKWWTDRNPGMAGANLFHSQQVGNLDVVLGANLLWDEGFIGPEPVGPDTANRDDRKYSDPAGYEQRIRVNAGLRYRHKKVKGLNYGINANAMRNTSTSVFIWDDIRAGLYSPEHGTVTYTQGAQYYVDPYVNYLSASNTRHTLRGRYLRQQFDNSGNQSNGSHFVLGEYQVQQKADIFGETVLTGGVVVQRTRSVAQLYSGNADGSDVNNATNASAYLQVDKKFFHERLALSAGMRYEHFKVNEDEQDVPVYRAGATYQVMRATFVRASYGQGYRFPTIGERFIQTKVGQLNIFSNPGLMPEESWNVEGGIKQGFKLGGFTGYLDVVAFQQDFQNYIEFTFGFWKPIAGNSFNDIAGFKSVNTGGARVSGIEVEMAGQGRIGAVDLTVLAGYTYTKPVSTTPDQIYAASPISTIPPYTYTNTSYDPSNNILKFRVEHLLRADVQADHRRLTLGVSVRYNSHVRNIDKIFVDLDESTSTLLTLPTGVSEWMATRRSGDTIFDARVGVRLGAHNRVSLIVNNVTNLAYAIRPLSVEPPRTFQVQLSRSI